MTDMRRWLEEGADGEVADLLSAGRPAEPLDDVVLERSRRRLRALERPRRRAGLFRALPAAATVLLWVQHAALGAGLGVVVALAAAAPQLIQRFSTPAPTTSSLPAPTKPTRKAPATPPAPVSAAPEPEASASAAVPPNGSVGAYPEPSARGEDFELELFLIERAKAELKTNPEAALRTLRTHRADFANGKLALERDFLTVVALVRLGRLAEARAHAGSLRARAPRNLYDERLRQLLDEPERVP